MCTFVFGSIYLSTLCNFGMNPLYSHMAFLKILTSFSAVPSCIVWNLPASSELWSTYWVRRRECHIFQQLFPILFISPEASFIIQEIHLSIVRLKGKKLFPLRSHFFCALFCLASWMCILGNWGQKERKDEEGEWAESTIP